MNIVHNIFKTCTSKRGSILIPCISAAAKLAGSDQNLLRRFYRIWKRGGLLKVLLWSLYRDPRESWPPICKRTFY